MPAGPTYREVTRRTAWTDLRALAWFMLLALLGWLLSSAAAHVTVDLDADVRRLLEGAPRVVVHIALVVLQSGALLLIAAFPIALVIARRWALLLRGAAAGVGGGLAFWAVAKVAVSPAAQQLTPVAAGFGPGFSSVMIAVAAAVVATLRPVASRMWLVPLWSLLALLAVVRTLASPDAPVDIVLALGVGGVIGTGVLLAFGRSSNELTADGVARVLAGVAVPVSAVAATPSSVWAFTATTPSGEELLVRVVDQHTWRLDNAGRTYRRLRLRDTGDESAFPTPSGVVRAEAMVTLLARDRGVNVPLVRAVARAPEGEALLAVDRVAGRSLAEHDAADLTPAALHSAWEQVDLLHTARIAHRDLTIAHVLLADDGAAWLTNLARGDAGVTDATLEADVAELLASTFAKVGASRAVAPALAVLGPDRVSAAAQRLVPVALTPATRTALKGLPEGLDPLLAEIERATGVERPAPLALERFKPRTLLIWAALAIAFYVLAPQLAEWPKMVQEIRTADWRWAPLLLAMSVATYLGSAIGLAGGTPGKVSVLQASGVAVAGSFVGTFSPPGVSTVGLNVRFLQRRGLPMPVAISAAAAKETAVGVMHVLVLVVVALWAGSSGALRAELKDLPPTHVIILVAIAVLALIGGAVAVPKVRALLRDHLAPAVRQAAEAMRPIASSPAKLTQLALGTACLPLGYAIALWAAVRAFDPTVSMATVMLVSLTAGALASAAPTPGGIGAVEAVLTAALTAVGLAPTTALAGVLLYRIATFWIPIAPGAAAFRVLTARKVL